MTTSCVCVALRQASRKLTAAYDEALQPAGISLAQYSLLKKINRHGPVSLTALAAIVDLDRSTLGRNLRVLERQELVALGSGKDLREARVTLTAPGRATLQRAIPLWETAQESITNKLGASGVAQLEALLGAL